MAGGTGVGMVGAPVGVKGENKKILLILNEVIACYTLFSTI